MDSGRHNNANSLPPPQMGTTLVSQERGGVGSRRRNDYRDNRFSYAQTPVAMQESFWGQHDRTLVERDDWEELATPIEEGTWTSSDGHQIQNRDRVSNDAHHILPSGGLAPSQNPFAILEPVQETTSPNRESERPGAHPVYHAPVAESTPLDANSVPLSTRIYAQPDPLYQPHQAYRPQPLHAFAAPELSASERFLSTREPSSRPYEASLLPMSHKHNEVKEVSPTLQYDHIQIPYSPNQSVFVVPGVHTGLSGLDPGKHQPGQIPHPNMQIIEYTGDTRPWLNSLCSCSTDVGTCLTGLFCPCILDGTTSYRMQQRSQRKDPTDLLGHETCNTRCGVFAVFGICGLCCLFPLTLRTRIRHAYRLQGNFCSDVLQSCCCCCCVAIQNEREIRDREEKMRQNAGPATQYMSSPRSMTYAPGGQF